MFVDGSSRVIQGKRNNGYAIVDGRRSEIKETGWLPNNCIETSKRDRENNILIKDMLMGCDSHIGKDRRGMRVD